MNKQEHWEYDPQRRAKASTGAMLRALVAGYLLYLAWQIVKGTRSGESSMNPVIAYAAAAFFALAAIAFVVYLIRRWRTDVEAAKLPVQTETGEADETEQVEE